jgi:HEPN domain-containing protein
MMTINTFDFPPGTDLQKKVTGLKSSALDEYQSARLLLLHNHLHQAAIHINSCIEKEMKAILSMKGIKYRWKHDTFRLFQQIEELIPDLRENVNVEFVQVLSQIYESRYADQLKVGYQFSILKNLYLVELDRTYVFLEKLTTPYGNDEDGNRRTPFEFNKHLELIQQDNHVVGEASKIALQSAIQEVFEYRIHPKWGEVTLRYEECPDDWDKFNYP